jgi:hydrogenase-1 operon protein HyaF
MVLELLEKKRMSPDFSDLLAKPFPIPVVALGPGAQPLDDGLAYLAMPSGMATYQPPRLPEPEELAGHASAVAMLHETLGRLQAVVQAQASGQPMPALCSVNLAGLPAADVQLINQVLGEGEVSAQVLAQSAWPGEVAGQPWVQVQESVFAGVWRVLHRSSDGSTQDSIELGPLPAVLLAAAHEDGQSVLPALPVPAEVINAPAVLTELAAHRQHWRPGQPAEVVNLTLLPLTPLDISFMDAQLGTGRVLILSRGYGNCRISSTRVPHTWRVVYYNSQDTVILNAVEVVGVPEVACAAPEDLADSAQRLAEVLAWVESEASAAPAPAVGA